MLYIIRSQHCVIGAETMVISLKSERIKRMTNNSFLHYNEWKAKTDSIEKHMPCDSFIINLTYLMETTKA